VGADAQSTFLVNIQVEALDRARLLSDVTRVLSDAHVNILSASVTTTRDRVAKSSASSPSRWPTRQAPSRATVLVKSVP
jgi:(p)ppGpp synthase/HD superfamily hydrolase